MGGEGVEVRPETSSLSKDTHRVEDSLKLQELMEICTKLSAEVVILTTTVGQLKQRQQEQDKEILDLRAELALLKTSSSVVGTTTDATTEGEIEDQVQV